MKIIMFTLVLLLLTTGCSDGYDNGILTVNENIEEDITISYIYDVSTLNENLLFGDGYSLLVETSYNSILVDTPYVEKFERNKGAMLQNMAQMGIDPKKIDTLFISHRHSSKAIDTLLEVNNHVNVYSVEDDYLELVMGRCAGDYIAVAEPQLICKGIYTTGALEGVAYDEPIYEQSLIIETGKGIIVIIGCCHPSVDAILGRIKELFPEEPIMMLIGGFHMDEVKDEKVFDNLLDQIESYDVARFVPSHCSGHEFFEYAKANSDMSCYEGEVGLVIQIR